MLGLSGQVIGFIVITQPYEVFVGRAAAPSADGFWFSNARIIG